MPSIEADVPLAPFTTLGIGGPARWFARARTVDDVAAAHAWSVEQAHPLFVLGGGSNLVIADAGFDGLVLQIDLRGVEFTPRGNRTIVAAGAGEAWDGLVAAAVARGLAGVECLSGIPGSVGGTPVQNVGAYGQEVGDTIETVTAFDRQAGTTTAIGRAACGFAYRTSRFKAEDAGRFIVCEVTFALQPGPPTLTYPDVRRYFDEQRVSAPQLQDARAAILAIRRRKGMVLDAVDSDTRSVGSFFMNPIVSADAHARISGAAGGSAPGFILADGRVKVPAAWLIEQAGFAKGYRAGRVGLSTKHPLAIVNRGGATADDVVELAATIKRGVLQRFGVALRPEPIFVGFGDEARVEYLQRG